MEETQSTDNFLALSPRAGRRLRILEKETRATWPRHHPLALLGNYDTSRTQDSAQTPQLDDILRTSAILGGHGVRIRNFAKLFFVTFLP